MVVPGVGNQLRRSYFSWREGVVPFTAFEIASEGTWEDDIDKKYDLYERLGVREYFLFDPEGVYLVPPLQGYRLNGSAYRRMRRGEIESELGFKLRAEDGMLRLIDARTGENVLTKTEQVHRANARVDQVQAAADAEKTRADAEKARGDALAAEVERLKKLLGENAP